MSGVQIAALSTAFPQNCASQQAPDGSAGRLTHERLCEARRERKSEVHPRIGRGSSHFELICYRLRILRNCIWQGTYSAVVSILRRLRTIALAHSRFLMSTVLRILTGLLALAATQCAIADDKVPEQSPSPSSCRKLPVVPTTPLRE